MTADPRTIVAESRMTARQITAVALIIGLNALDGFDVLAISFASPGIAAEWSIDRAALGIVLSMELIGMALGSIFLGGVADRVGRRPTILTCLTVMAAGMFLTTTASSIAALSVWRVLTGLGIGGMVAALTAAVAEHSNSRNRNLCVALVAIGYPMGAIIGGSVAAMLLKTHDWRTVFLFGGTVTALFIPLVLLALPETIAFLVRKRPQGALQKINRILARLGHEPAVALPPEESAEKKYSVRDILRPGLIGTTLILTLAYFLHIGTFYFILKWIPKIVVDMGFDPSSAAGVLVWANVGGAAGGITFGVLSRFLPLKWLTIGVLLASTALVSIFGMGQSDLTQLALAAGIAGVFTNAGVVGFYAIFAQAFPTHVRATGTGFAIGVGRGGAAIAPIIPGFLFSAGYGLQAVAIFMSMGALAAAITLSFLRERKGAFEGGRQKDQSHAHPLPRSL
ncbi:MFS transporter [Rhizorhapis sp.]|uniref:MFS transporter n=1 Tax=Rhizorhapis sp. TaxID=1968842 RepID=UPI002B4867F0|nr:MFS transporter [Rhizorhapis sp.]HKR18400.1 MFS transporter [Rhizorhapis sp.]